MMMLVARCLMLDSVLTASRQRMHANKAERKSSPLAMVSHRLDEGVTRSMESARRLSGSSDAGMTF